MFDSLRFDTGRYESYSDMIVATVSIMRITTHATLSGFNFPILPVSVYLTDNKLRVEFL